MSDSYNVLYLLGLVKKIVEDGWFEIEYYCGNLQCLSSQKLLGSIVFGLVIAILYYSNLAVFKTLTRSIDLL